jgi:hypothetical protein
VQRQFLVFLHGRDEADLLARIMALEPELVLVPGKYVTTGDAAALLAQPAAFDPLPALRSQRRLYLARRAAPPVLQEQTAGPQRGRFALDERRSELLELALGMPQHGRLAPSRLAASIFVDEQGEHDKKSAEFVRLVNRVLRALEAAYPLTSLDFVHLAEGALAFAAGGGQLTYLEEKVLPAPGGTRNRPPHERIRIP